MEAKRLVFEEKINEFAANGQYDILKKVGCQIPIEVKEYLGNNDLRLPTAIIPNDYCLALAIITRTCQCMDESFFENKYTFRERLEKEVGKLGKNISKLMEKANLSAIKEDDFFSERYVA